MSKWTNTITLKSYVTHDYIDVDKLEESEVGGRICAGEDVLLVVRYTNGVEKVEMLVYSTKDGLLEQTILLDFIPAYMTQPLGGTKLI